MTNQNRKQNAAVRVHFKLILTPCCGTLLCHINPSLPNFCPECGKHIFAQIKECILDDDVDVILKYTYGNESVKST